jgi:ABC-type nitrate/sulfonate/bicarbonate transport system permease component
MTTTEESTAVGTPATPGVPTRGRPRSRHARRWWLPWVTTLGTLAVWELLCRTGFFPSELPPVSEILVALARLAGTAQMWVALGNTVVQFLVGMVVGSLIGIALGVAIGLSRTLDTLLRGLLEFLRFIPSVVYLPALILVVGMKPEIAYILGTVAAVWPTLYQTYYGVSGIPAVLSDTGRVFGFTWLMRLRFIVLPQVSPFVATGIRIASSHVLVVVVAVEIISLIPGIGREITVFATNAVYPSMYAMIALAGFLGVVMNLGLGRFERRVLRWHPSQRGELS